MEVCGRCGQPLVEGKKFCAECGAYVGVAGRKEEEKKEQGGYRKCPGCGSTVGSFSTHCPMCGNEMGNVIAANSARELTEKLERISARKMTSADYYPPSDDLSAEERLAERETAISDFEAAKEKEKAELIVNFPVPNGREDLLEFMILASSNIDNTAGNSRELIKAWMIKQEQIFNKARLSMGNGADFSHIKILYDKTQGKIAKRRKRNWRIAMSILAAVGFLAILVTFIATRPTQFESMEVRNVSMELPSYWEEDDSTKDSLNYYAEVDSGLISEYKTVTLAVEFHEETDDSYDVSFAGLEKDNQNMIKALEGKFSDSNVLSDEVFVSDHGVKGILYRFSLSISTGMFSDEAGKGYCFCFPSEDDHRWYYVTMIVSNQASGSSYLDDYMKTLHSIKCQ